MQSSSKFYKILQGHGKSNSQIHMEKQKTQDNQNNPEKSKNLGRNHHLWYQALLQNNSDNNLHGAGTETERLVNGFKFKSEK